ncbi:MAG: prolipoprotein diacylglyceryl transferase [Clostridia bacterium]|nr:prolipoprotein diacylglyceryl transferase [Clostridia bacterium]
MFLAADSVTVVEFPKLGWGPWELNRFVFQDLFGSLSVAWYGLIICCAMIAACFLVLRNARKYERIKRDSFLDYFLAAIPLSIVGARLMYVLTRLDLYQSFWDAFKIWEGGLAVYGGVIAGFLTVFILSRVKKDSFFRVLDAIVPGLILAQCIGRWGNFINGEAHGGFTDLPWGMMINGAGPYHPTFLYESLLTLTGFIILQFVLYPRKKFDGENLCFYLVWYGVGRTFIEGMRTDSLYFGPLRASQVIGVASAVIGAVLFFLLWKAGRKTALAEAAEETSEKTAEETEETAGETAEETSEETAGETAEETVEEAAGETAPPENKETPDAPSDGKEN